MRTIGSTSARLARGGVGRGRRTVAALVGWSTALLLVLSVGGVVAYGAIKVSDPVNHGLKAVGPTSGENGFPVWYKDNNDVRLEPCIDANDPNCAAAAPLPDPSKPMSFPDNFPDEMFYQLADNVINDPANPALNAKSMFNLEGAFGTGAPKAGDQIVFGRIRYQWKSMPVNTTFRVTHPYGVDEVTSDGTGKVFETEDVGLATGQFGEALNSRIGPFLKSTSAPAGYLGDGATATTITGSPLNQNLVRIQSLDANGNPDGKLDLSQPQFTVMGKLATTSGVGVDRVTYSRTDGTGGMLDVYANSEVGSQSIQVTGAGFDPTLLRGENGHYAARVPYTGAVPKTVTVTNVGDVPASVKKDVPVTDAVSGTAVYNADTSTLTVKAQSSDTWATSGPTLTVKEFTGAAFDASGVLTVTALSGPPASVTVNSTDGGSATLPVTMQGAGFAPVSVLAVAGPDQNVPLGATVKLDASASVGTTANTTFSWSKDGAEFATGQTATFTAPSTAGKVTVTLTATNPGGPSTDTVDINVVDVSAAPDPVATITGPTAPVAQSTPVTLDGSTTTNATTLKWTQTGGDPVTLSSTTTPTVTFTTPKTQGTLTFKLDASSAKSTATATYTVTVKPDTLAPPTRAQFTRSTGEWRIEGTSSTLGPNNPTVTAYPGPTATGTPIGFASVDATGAYRIRVNVTGSLVPPTTASGTNVFGRPQTISLKSSSGGQLLAQPFTAK
jgi:hypothetical protein